MNLHTLRILVIPVILLWRPVFVQAQFDDVYYDPDNDHYSHFQPHQGNPSSSANTDDYGVTYYDNDDAYDEFDDYDYYYTSRIRRFHHFYFGFDYFSPAFTCYYYYDPFYTDAYYYPGSSIYVNFGNWSYWNYHNWCGWNNWNYYNPYNAWCPSPYSYYYGYNGWWGGNYNYWGGCNGYYSYSHYYNNYYYGCPYPVGNHWGIDHHTCDWVNSGNERGTYYGPRITGNTGSSPRGPIQPPGITQPVLAGKTLAEQRDHPVSPEVSGAPGIRNTPVPDVNGVSARPESMPVTRNDAIAQHNKPIPVDKELKHEQSPSVSRRPVFKPQAQGPELNPGRNTDEVASIDSKPDVSKPLYTPYTPPRNSTPANVDKPLNKNNNDRPAYTPSGNDNKPLFRSSHNSTPDRPKYSPPTRSNDRNDNSPAPGDYNGRNHNDRPSYTPPSKPNPSDSGKSPAGHSRSYDNGPSFTPRNDTPSHNSPSRGSSSGSSGHSSSGNGGSGHSSGGSSSSPRGRG